MGRLFEIRLILIAVVISIGAASGFSGNKNLGRVIDHTGTHASRELHVSVDLPFLSEFALHEGCYTGPAAGPVYSLSKQWHSFKAAIQLSEIQVVQDLTQVVSEILNFPVRIRKSDLLFPFHYFF